MIFKTKLFIIFICCIVFVVCSWCFYFRKKSLLCKPVISYSLGLEMAYERALLCLQEEEKSNIHSFFIFKSLLEKAERDKNLYISVEVKEKLAWISFYVLKNYELSLRYYTDLLRQQNLTKTDLFVFTYHVAKSFFHLGKMQQAMVEIKNLNPVNKIQEEDKLLLQSSILLALQDWDNALKLIHLQIEKFPRKESFFKEYIGFIHEVKKDLVSSTKVLQTIRYTNPFIEQKVKSFFESERIRVSGVGDL